MRLIYLFVLLLVGCGMGQYEEEYAAYTRYLNAEVAAGRMTRQEAEYLAIKRSRQLTQKSDAEAVESFNSGYELGKKARQK